ncbi:tyrosine-type recombinase/integrase [Desulfotignum balticum]|jgi:integrase|uniref:tyrosine-type recombinase/integrase n=2 Tax=Desulfotignum balticum TaxID=115781 RepID=UPI00040EF20F|nr:tyrosine-type recombinase/integrase [Desulfotignum balticum]
MKPFESFLNNELENFIVYRKGLGYKEKLIRSRLVIFDKYVKKQADPSSVWNPDFYLAFRKEVGEEPSTVNITLSAVRCFFEYLKRKDPLLNNPLKDVPNLQRRPFVPFVFSPEQVDMLLDVICGRIRRHTQRVFLKDFSEYLVILLLARCGLRISEPLRLKLADYRPDEKTIYIEKTKFSKDRLIPIPLSVARQIDNYLSCRAALIEHDINPYLFIGGLQKRLGDQRIRVVFHSAVQQIGIDSPRKVIGDTTFGKPTPHSLRHSFAIYTLKSAIARKQTSQNVLPVLAAYMGHVKYQYTMEYLRVVDAESRTRLLNFADILRKKSCD